MRVVATRFVVVRAGALVRLVFRAAFAEVRVAAFAGDFGAGSSYSLSLLLLSGGGPLLAAARFGGDLARGCAWVGFSGARFPGGFG